MAGKIVPTGTADRASRQFHGDETPGMRDLGAPRIKSHQYQSCWGCGMDWVNRWNAPHRGLGQTNLIKMKKTSKYHGAGLCPDCYEEEGYPEHLVKESMNSDELFTAIMESGNVDLLDEGIFGDLFRKAGTAIGRAIPRGRPQRQIGARAELMPGFKQLGPGREPMALQGHVTQSKHPGSAYAASRMLPAVSAKTNPAAHPILHALHDNQYSPQFEYHHPEGGHFSVWMQHGTDRRGNPINYPTEEGGQFHVEHGETGHPTGKWHYFHPPENHANNAGYHSGNTNRERFDDDPETHKNLEHPENNSDYDNYRASEDHGKYDKGAVGHHLSRFIGDLEDLKPDNAHHGGRYSSDEESTLERSGWRHSEDDNHNTHEKYDFASDPVSKYTNDKKYPDHEIHLHASGGWKHFAPDSSEPVATHNDGGDLSHYLKYGIKDALGASVHDQRDEEEGFPDHTHPQHNMGSGPKGYHGDGEEDDDED